MWPLVTASGLTPHLLSAADGHVSGHRDQGLLDPDGQLGGGGGDAGDIEVTGTLHGEVSDNVHHPLRCSASH